MYCVIMAGGSGTRFWPLSRRAKPKQLLDIVGDKSMLQMTVDRLKKLKVVEDIFIVTGAELAEKILKSIKGISAENIIIEPSGKNTAPCIGLAALRIGELQKDAVMGVFPADHLIVGHRKFVRAISTSNRLAKQNQTVVTIGIIPTFPSTAYGYIQHTKESTAHYLDAHSLKAFAEKPHLRLAERFIESGDFLWNSGIFFWRVDVLMDLMKTHLPDLHDRLQKMKSLLNQKEDITAIWEGIVPQSIDYGIMEKVASNAYVVRADFDWNDVGSWNAVCDILQKNKKGNVVRGNGLVLNGKENFIHSYDHFTAVLGLDNVVVVHTEDATLVVHKDQAEEVKLLVEKMGKTDWDDLL